MIKFNTDLSGLEGFKNLESVTQDAIQTAIRELSALTRMHITEQANIKLHTRLKMFLDELSHYQEDKDTWVVNLGADAVWINDGMCVVYDPSQKEFPQVLTPKGWINITSMCIGDKVLNIHQKWTKVLKIHDSLLKDDEDLILLRVPVLFSSNNITRSLILTKNHPVFSDGNWKLAKDLLDGDRIIIGEMKETGEACLSTHELYSKNIIAIKDYSHCARRWDITVEEGNSFVCQGLLIHNSPHNMVQQLLSSSKAKTGKDGSRYLSIPFKHNKGPTQQTPQQQLLLNTIKQVLKQNKIPFSKAEVDIEGKVKTGLVRSFNIDNLPLKTSNMPGQGKGQIGLVQQGWSADGKSGTPLLHGLQIYQRQYKTQSGMTRTTKDFMTFRTVSSKHLAPEPGKGQQLKLMSTGEARWDHPGLEPTHLMEEGMEWATRQLTDHIGPQILDKIKISM